MSPVRCKDVELLADVLKLQRFCRDPAIFLRKGVDRTIAALHNCNPSKQTVCGSKGSRKGCVSSRSLKT